MGDENAALNPAAEEPRPARKPERTSWFDIAMGFADVLPGFKTARENIARRVPKRYHRPVKIIALVGSAGTLFFTMYSPMSHFLQEAYGPDVVIGVTSARDLAKFGQKSLLYEFVFNEDRLASQVSANRHVSELFASADPVKLEPICEISLDGETMRVAKLVLVAQNSGHRTATGYEMMVNFSSKDPMRPDPGVRILGVSTDALTPSYLYQQAAPATIRKALASCADLKPYLREMEPPAKDKKAEDEKRPAVDRIPELTRDTYRGLGLTRDLLILNGTLEAHLFQLATVVVAVPLHAPLFATVFHVTCGNCSWFIKTNSFAQLVSMESGSTVKGSQPLP